MKKGLSPVIITVILISLVIIMGIFIFSVLKGITGKVIMLEGKNIALVCEDVKFKVAYNGETLYFSNTGNIKIYQIKAKVFKETNYQTIDADEFLDDWPADGLNSGEVFSGSVNFNSDVQKIIILPVLIGKTAKGIKETYTCPEVWGEEIKLE